MRSPRTIASFALVASLASLTACAGKGASEAADPSSAEDEASDRASEAYSRGLASDTPPPLVVCDHVIAMMQRELGDDALPEAEVDELRRGCVRDGDEQRALFGEEAYATQARCALGTERLDELQRCEDPEPAAGDVPDPTLVCDHVIDLMKRELGDAVDAMPVEEIEAIRAECVFEAGKERTIVGDQAYGAQARCVLAARSLEGLEACEDDTEASARAGSGVQPERVCEHIVDIMEAELGGGDQQPSDRELREIVDSCTTDLRARMTQIDERAFAAEIACVMAASSMESLLACDPD